MYILLYVCDFVKHSNQDICIMQDILKSYSEEVNTAGVCICRIYIFQEIELLWTNTCQCNFTSLLVFLRPFCFTDSLNAFV